MRVASNCTAFAAALSANYRNTQPFHPQDSDLNSYLSNHGVLLTMCMGNICTVNPYEDGAHLSGSWINEETGARMIGYSSVGFILSPSHSKIRCLYPSDAGTVGRDNKGCGAPVMDPVYGRDGYAKSNRLKRFEMKQGLKNYLKVNFETDSVPCDVVFGDLGVTMWKGSGNNITLLDTYQTLADYFSPFLGRPFCDSAGSDSGSDKGFRLYQGVSPLQPDEFQVMVDTMLELTRIDAESRLLWNEIVMDLPKRMSDVVSAVFYIESTPDSFPHRDVHKQAKAQARALGGVPVLVMDPSSMGDLFSCAPETVSGEKQGYMAFQLMQNVPIFRVPLSDLIANPSSYLEDPEVSKAE